MLLAEIDRAAGGSRRLDAATALLRRELKEAGADSAAAQGRARSLAGLITVVLQAAQLVRCAPAAIRDAFCAARLGPAADGAGAAGPALPFGQLPDGIDRAAVLARSRSVVQPR